MPLRSRTTLLAPISRRFPQTAGPCPPRSPNNSSPPARLPDDSHTPGPKIPHDHPAFKLPAPGPAPWRCSSPLPRAPDPYLMSCECSRTLCCVLNSFSTDPQVTSSTPGLAARLPAAKSASSSPSCASPAARPQTALHIAPAGLRQLRCWGSFRLRHRPIRFNRARRGSQSPALTALHWAGREGTRPQLSRAEDGRGWRHEDGFDWSTLPKTHQ